MFHVFDGRFFRIAETAKRRRTREHFGVKMMFRFVFLSFVTIFKHPPRRKETRCENDRGDLFETHRNEQVGNKLNYPPVN